MARGGAQFGGSGSSVLVLVTDPETAPVFPEEALKKPFALAPAELRVASEIAAGRSPDEIADPIGRIRNTVRVQANRSTQRRAPRGKANWSEWSRACRDDRAADRIGSRIVQMHQD